MIDSVKDSYLFRLLSKHWLTTAFLLGFATDLILLNRVDDTFDNLILLMYAVLASVSLLLFYVGVAERWGARVSAWLLRLTPPVMQYSFGGMLSGMLIFYGRSGDLLVSAPYLILIVSVMIANEVIKKRSDRLVYNLAVYFIGLFSYLVLVVPVLIGEMGPVVFVGSGWLALVVIYLLYILLAKIIPHFLRLESRKIVFTIFGLYALFNGLYFTNVIPPIPLSLTELSIYHQVERSSSGGYRITKVDETWLDKLSWRPMVFSHIVW
jgi:hypothetical protein